MASYTRAMRAAIRPGDVVLDLGAGPGVTSLIACQLGASKVYAVDPSEWLTVGKHLAKTNGFEQHIVFLKGSAVDVSLPEKVDVIISDLRGVLPLYFGHLDSLSGAIRDHLKPGGRVICEKDSIVCSPVVDANVHKQHFSAWAPNYNGLDLGIVRRWLVGQPSKVNLRSNQVLCPGQNWCDIDYLSAGSSLVFDRELSWVASESQVVVGLAAWLDGKLYGGARLDSSPGKQQLIYGQMYFPVLAGIAICAGMTLKVRLKARFVDQNYLWKWQLSVVDAGGSIVETVCHSEFEGFPIGLG